LARTGDRVAALQDAHERWNAKRKAGYSDPQVERFFPTFEALTAKRDLDFATLAERTFAAHLGCRSEV